MAFEIDGQELDARGATWPADAKRLGARILSGPEQPLLDSEEPDRLTAGDWFVVFALAAVVAGLIYFSGGAA